MNYKEIIRNAENYTFTVPSNQIYSSPHEFISKVGMQLIEKDCLLVHIADMAGVNYERVNTDHARSSYVEHKINFFLDTYNSGLVKEVADSIGCSPDKVSLYDHEKECLNMYVTENERGDSKFSAYYLTMYSLFEDLGYDSRDFMNKPYSIK